MSVTTGSILLMSPDTMTQIGMSAVLARNEYTQDPGPAIRELREFGRDDLLPEVIGIWIGAARIPERETLVRTLLDEFGHLDLEPWIRVGRERSGRGHRTP